MIPLLLAVLATYRVARMLATEEGPALLCIKFRNLYQAEDWIGRGIRCPLCLGFWVALPLAWWVAPSLADVPLWWLGVAGAQATLHVGLEMGRAR